MRELEIQPEEAGTIDRKHLYRRVYLALAVLIVPLVLSSAVSVAYHRSAAVNARYTVALSQLVEGMARLEGSVAKVEAGHAEDPAKLYAVFADALGFFGAMRAADPDGDEIMEEGASSERDTLTALTKAAGINPVALSKQMGLLGHEMPEALEAVWEEEDGWEAGEQTSDGHAPSLEKSFAANLLAAAPIFAEGKRDAAAFQNFWQASDGTTESQRVEVLTVLQDASVVASRTPLILAVAVLGIALMAAVFGWNFVVQPLIRYVLGIQDDLEREAVAARAADKAKTEFLATVSHELRTPMNGIIGAVQVLEVSDLSEDDREMMDIISTCAEGQMSLIEEILTFGEVEAGALRFVVEPVSVSHLMRESTSFAKVGAQQKGLSLDVTVAEDVPEIVGDAKRLRQMIMNLVSNAVKFTEAGSIQVNATVQELDTPDIAEFRVTVTDTGAGIAPEHRTRIFERFTQGDSSSSRKAGGTGLGLAIARSIAREMGGDITMTSEVGKGSVFTLSAPMIVGGPAVGNASGEREAA